MFWAKVGYNRQKPIVAIKEKIVLCVIVEVIVKSFAPAIIVEDKTVTPKGYEWVLGFALSGCDWAIKKASEPEFLEMIRVDLKQEAVARLEMLIKQYEYKISKMKSDLDIYT